MARHDDDGGTTRNLPALVPGSGTMIQAVPEPRPDAPEEDGAVESTGATEARDASDPAPAPSAAGDAEPDGNAVRRPDFLARTLYLPRRLARRLDAVAKALAREPSEIAAAALDAQLDRLGDRPGADAAAGAGSLPANGNGHAPANGGAPPGGTSEAMTSCLETLRAAAREPLDGAAVRRAAARILKSLDRWQPNAIEHAEAVARLSFRLGSELDLDNLDVETAELAGLLHDIGKLQVPAEILHKRGALTSKEWQLVRGYPEWGAQALEELQGFGPLVPLVRYHKETWDGRGYPHGLEGEDIPLGAQVIGIADAFHTMLSPRPYRPALSLEQARTCVQENIGALWAPAVAEALLDVAADAAKSG